MTSIILTMRLIHRSINLLGLFLLCSTVTVIADEYTLLNVSYDVSRELYKDINVAFADQWLKKPAIK